MCQSYGRIIGVSKRCCPVCYTLIKNLSTTTKPGFVIKGSHGAITACTLPEWLPLGHVNDMNKHFGDMLRIELSKLMQSNITSLRKRNVSSGSRAASVGSNDEGPLLRRKYQKTSAE